MIKSDLIDWYYHLGNRQVDRRYLCFRVGRRLFLPLCFNWGICCTPILFTKIMRPFVGHLRRMGHDTVSYLDVVGGAPRMGVADAIISTV